MDFQAAAQQLTKDYQEKMKVLQDEMSKKREEIRRNYNNPAYNPFAQTVQQVPQQEITSNPTETPQETTAPLAIQQLTALGTINTNIEKLITLIEERFPQSLEEEFASVENSTEEAVPAVITFTEEEKNATPKANSNGTNKVKR